MTRKLATVRIINDLQPIEKADKIELAIVDGWKCVVRKNEFKINDACVYIEIDSILPDVPYFKFMRERKFRVKTIKLRGQVSQGLVLPMDIIRLFSSKKFSIGDDVTDVLGITKYDDQAMLERESIATSRLGRRNKDGVFNRLFRVLGIKKYTPRTDPRSRFPAFIKNSDEERVQNLGSFLQANRETLVSVTEKLDGQSATYYLLKTSKFFGLVKNEEFGVCSRNYHLYKEDSSSYWQVARLFNIKYILSKIIDSMPSCSLMVMQGEIIGNGIQKNKYKIDGYDFYVYNFVIDRWPSSENTDYICSLLEPLGMKVVPVVLHNINIPLYNGVDYFVELSSGKSVINTSIEREGIVCRSNNGLISFKAINPEFLLKNGE